MVAFWCGLGKVKRGKTHKIVKGVINFYDENFFKGMVMLFVLNTNHLAKLMHEQYDKTFNDWGLYERWLF